MDVASDIAPVVATARSGQLPTGWYVWPLRRDFVRRSALSWGLVALIFIPVFVGVALVTIPYNFDGSAAKAVFTIIILGVLAAVAFGGLGIAIYDAWRLAHAEDFLLIMTPDDFVKVEPRHTVHVPMSAVTNVTLRGVKQGNARHPEETSGMEVLRNTRTMYARQMSGFTRFPVNRQPAEPPSLAFIDQRTNRKVVVATDFSFENLIALEDVLSTLADIKQRQGSSGFSFK